MSERDGLICATGITKLAPALVAAIGELENPRKDKRGNYGSYADLAAILELVRPVLARHKLALLQPTHRMADAVGVSTRILHESGEWLESEVLWLPAGANAQTAGSAITYARRYSLTALLGIAGDDDDDDGRASAQTSGRTTGARTPKGKGTDAGKRPAGEPEPDGAAEEVGTREGPASSADSFKAGDRQLFELRRLYGTDAHVARAASQMFGRSVGVKELDELTVAEADRLIAEVAGR